MTSSQGWGEFFKYNWGKLLICAFAIAATATIAALSATGNFSRHTTSSAAASQAQSQSAYSYKPRDRWYYISAETVLWSYADSDVNLMTGHNFSDEEVSSVFMVNSPDRIGHQYYKVLYYQYTDDTFTIKMNRTADEEHMGNMGPAIRAVVGDEVYVLFKNLSPIPLTIHVHGILYNKSSEGAPYEDETAAHLSGDDTVESGGQHLYHYLVPSNAGPRSSSNITSKLWAYHSHVDTPTDIYTGLVGPIVVVATNAIKNDDDANAAWPSDVDRELFLYFSVTDENSNALLNDTMVEFTDYTVEDTALIEDGDFVESNLMHSINGKMYGHLKGLTTKYGEKARWYTYSFGTEVDLHTAHWHGNVLYDSFEEPLDTEILIPAIFRTLDMVPDNPGMWRVECHVHDHLTGGMETMFRVDS